MKKIFVALSLLFFGIAAALYVRNEIVPSIEIIIIYLKYFVKQPAFYVMLGIVCLFIVWTHDLYKRAKKINNKH